MFLTSGPAMINERGVAAVPTPSLAADDCSLSFRETVRRYCSSSVVDQPITRTTDDTRAFPLRELTGNVDAKQVIA